MCEPGGLPVGAGYGEAFLMENLGKPAHADAAYADEVNVAGSIEIDFIHRLHFLTVSYIIVCNYYKQYGRKKQTEKIRFVNKSRNCTNMFLIV